MTDLTTEPAKAVRRAKLGFAELSVDVPSHICLFYSDDNELRQRLGFLAHTLDEPDQVAVLFGKQERLEEVLGYIGTDFRRDLADDLKAGRIVLVNGNRDPDALLGGIATALDATVARGATLIRFLGFIGWGDMDWPETEDLMVFEAKVTEAVKSYPAVVVCTYNTEKLPGSVLIFAGIETHPFTILGTTLCENPHYVPFADYIERRGRPTKAQREKNLAGVTVGRLG
ncbi:MAG TPA: MEDS domain-containing protein [Candidatus Limnocylindria bacterium]|nr:MEDS domain-containing protein [Candidatus Limnocylindria bacterium]